MATLRNKRKLAAVTRETQEEHPRNGQSRNTSVPRNNEEYIAQVSEEIEGRVTRKLSHEFSRTESRILGALSKLDEFLLNPQIRTFSEPFREHSGTQTWKTRNQMRIVLRMILILKWDPPHVNPVIQLTQTQTRHLTHTKQAPAARYRFAIKNEKLRSSAGGIELFWMNQFDSTPPLCFKSERRYRSLQ